MITLRNINLHIINISLCFCYKDGELYNRQFQVSDEREKNGIQHENSKKMPILNEPALMLSTIPD